MADAKQAGETRGLTALEPRGPNDPPAGSGAWRAAALATDGHDTELRTEVSAGLARLKALRVALADVTPAGPRSPVTAEAGRLAEEVAAHIAATNPDDADVAVTRFLGLVLDRLEGMDRGE